MKRRFAFVAVISSFCLVESLHAEVRVNPASQKLQPLTCPHVLQAVRDKMSESLGASFRASRNDRDFVLYLRLHSFDAMPIPELRVDWNQILIEQMSALNIRELGWSENRDGQRILRVEGAKDSLKKFLRLRVIERASLVPI